MTSDNYISVNINKISPAKLKKLMKTGKISFSAVDLMGDEKMYLHPLNAKLIQKAQKAKKGVNGISITGGELNMNMVHGGSFFSMLKNLGSTIYKGLTSEGGKKILGTIADVAVPAAATFLGAPEFAGVAREGLKDLTGIGLKEKRQANLAKARAARAAKKSDGGSFRIGGSGSFMI